MRTMYDAVDPTAIPADAGMVAGYIDGKYKWSDSAWNLFPNATKIRVAVNPATDDGHVLDVEQGNWTALDSVGWVQKRRVSGLLYPAVYCDNQVPGYDWGDIIQAHLNANVLPPLIWYSGFYNPTPLISMINGVVAWQCTVGGPADISRVLDYWPGVDVQPVDIDLARKYAADASVRIRRAMYIYNTQSVELNAALESLQF